MSIKPAFRYHGAKWMLAPWLIKHLPPHQVYVEPFGGSAAVLLRKRQSYAEVYNDIDSDVVNIFKVLRDPIKSSQLRESVALTPFSRDEFAAAGWGVTRPDGLSDVGRARLFLVRSYQGFGSNSVHKSTGFRSCSNRRGSTPAKDWARWPDRVPALTERLRGVVIENRDYREVVAAHDGADTLTYFDSPYDLSTRDAGKDYAHEFDESDHVELASIARSSRGMVIVSSYRSEMYDDLYKGWVRVDRKALADGARVRTESIWINASAWAAQKQMGLGLRKMEECSA